MLTIEGVLIYGVVLGAVYLLVAMGFSLICGVLGIFNLGYSATILVAVYGVWMIMSTFGLGLTFGIIGVFFLQVLFTLAILYYAIIKPNMEKEDVLLTALLLLSLIVEAAVNYWYPLSTGVDLPTTILEGVVRIGQVTLPRQMFVVVAAALIITIAFIIFFTKTRMGLKVRALSQDHRAARILGVNVERVYALAVILAVLPPTICMIVVAPMWAINPKMGHSLFQTAILVTILGGLGNLRGTLLASFIVGLIAASVNFLLNPRLVSLAILVVVFAVMMIKPEGIAKSETIW